jgi:hypothetical protein
MTDYIENYKTQYENTDLLCDYVEEAISNLEELQDHILEPRDNEPVYKLNTIGRDIINNSKAQKLPYPSTADLLKVGGLDPVMVINTETKRFEQATRDTYKDIIENVHEINKSLKEALAIMKEDPYLTDSTTKLENVIYDCNSLERDLRNTPFMQKANQHNFDNIIKDSLDTLYPIQNELENNRAIAEAELWDREDAIENCKNALEYDDGDLEWE